MYTLKRYLSISFMLLATLALSVFTVIPHHHHEGRICMITEVCDSQDPFHDEHPTHHHADDTNHRNHNCVAESDIVIPDNKEEIKCKFCVCHYCDPIHHFPILCLLAEFLIYEKLSAPKPEYGAFIVLYKSPDASQRHGLRAPPFFTV